jgi:hypothetical protein
MTSPAPGIVKVNPAATTTKTNLQGAHLTFVKVLYKDVSTGAINMSGEAGPLGAQQAVLLAIEQIAGISYIGPLYNGAGTNDAQCFVLESVAGNNPLVCAADGTVNTASGSLQALLQALGTTVGTGGVDLSGTTVTTASGTAMVLF